MLVAFSITPLGIGADVGETVAEAVRVVRDSGLPNRSQPSQSPPRSSPCR